MEASLSPNPAWRLLAATDSAAPGRSRLRQVVGTPAAWATLALAAVLAVIRFGWPGASYGPSLGVELLADGATAMAMATVMIGGGIDLSVGAVMALAGGVAATCLHGGMAWWLALAGGLLAGAAVGSVNGWLVTVAALPPTLATLASFAVTAATATALRGNMAVAPLGHPLRLLAALAAGMAAALSMTVWGRHVVAVGSNAVAARAHGVDVAGVTTGTYVVSGALAALAGVAALAAPGTPTPGIAESLQAVAAASLGGASLAGGEGGIGGALIGAALLVAVRHALPLAGLDARLLGVGVGLCIAVAAAKRRRARR